MLAASVFSYVFLYCQSNRLLCVQYLWQLQGGFVEAVAAEWRSMSKSERAYWEGMAKKDKTRHSKETKSFKGPIGRKLRTKKNPLAPKRPMSGERLHLEFPLLSLGFAAF